VTTVLGPARVVLPGAQVLEGYVSVDDGRIAAVSTTRPEPSTDVVDLGRAWLTAGFVDLHVHGGNGASFMDQSAAAVATAAAFHLAHGTTSVVASTWSASSEVLRRSVDAIVGAAPPNVVGIHLEGPYLSELRRGAQPAEHLRPPDPAELDALIAASGGTIRLMTIAPELPGALEMIAQLRAAGAAASVGHTDATYDQTIAAIDAGARHATHLCNGMRPIHHREPGPIAAFLERADTTAEVIADGQHLSPTALRLIHRAKGSRSVALVTDALGVAGLGEGCHHHGGWDVRVIGDTVELADGSSLAGSALTMERAVANAVRFLGVPLAEAVAMASEVPAGVVGLSDRKGAIAPGCDADLLVLDDDGRVLRVMLAGKWVARPTA
jgi:N-acetylglucosamine-6-phosphate deacetylase